MPRGGNVMGGSVTGAVPEWRQKLRDRFNLRQFLEGLGLAEWEDFFIDEGFDTLESMMGIQEEDMDAMGLRTGHKRRVLVAVRDLLDQAAAAKRIAGVLSPSHGQEMGMMEEAGGFDDASDAGDSRPAGVRRLTLGGASDIGSEEDGEGAGDEEDIFVQELFAGDGHYPEEGQVVRVHYIGRFADGREFENSRERGRPFQFKLGVGQVIRGWDVAVRKMTRGSRAKFAVPASMGYGADGRMPVIPPDTPLEFELQLIDFHDPNVELTPRDEYDPEIDGIPDGE
jgi:hypothetical protein